MVVRSTLAQVIADAERVLGRSLTSVELSLIHFTYNHTQVV
jgi:energy-converting hydrogenase Eha subunit E